MKKIKAAQKLGAVLDFRVMVLAVAAALSFAVGASDARDGAAHRQHATGAHSGGTTSVQRSRGADGAVDATRTGRNGGATTVDRFQRRQRHYRRPNHGSARRRQHGRPHARQPTDSSTRR